MAFDIIHDTEQTMNDEQKLLWDRLFKELDGIKVAHKESYDTLSDRVSVLEKWQYKILGAAAVISVVAPIVYEAIK